MRKAEFSVTLFFLDEFSDEFLLHIFGYEHEHRMQDGNFRQINFSDRVFAKSMLDI